MKLSSRVLAMQASPIRKLVPFALAAKARGTHVYHLNIGQPDIETPKEFMAAVRSFDESVLSYALSGGYPPLVEAIKGYYERLGISFDSSDIIITNGGSEALQFALVSVCDYDDEVLIPEPFYTNYNGFSQPFGVRVKPITTAPEDGFALPAEEVIQGLITEKTKAFLLSNPGNPTGAVYSREDVQKLADLARRNDLFIIADEVYREFAYDGAEVVSFASLSEVEDRVIIVDSVSKRFSACGARIGCMISKNKELMQNVMKLAQARLCCPTLDMIGATALYGLDPSYFDPIREEYTKRRNILIQGLREIPGVLCKVPGGAFYAVAKLPIDNAEDFAKWLLEDFSHEGKTVMVAPNEGFYATEGLGVQEVRMAYVLKSEDLEEAVRLLKIALEEYPGRIQ